MNGLQGPSVTPWHIKASYQSFDSQGRLKYAGTYEEFWISPAKYKLSFTSPKFTQIDYGTGPGLYRIGTQDWPGVTEMRVRREIIEPIPETLNSLNLHLAKKKTSIGPVKLECLTLEFPGAAVGNSLYCFSQNQPVLRLAASWGGQSQIEYNHIVEFQGHYIAEDIQDNNRGKPLLSVHIETIEPLTTFNESDFAPPAAARLISGPVSLPENSIAALCLIEYLPWYPESATLSRIQGAVAIDVTVGPNGDIENAQAVSGPPPLRDVSVRTVRKWKFEPFLLLGKPVPVHGQVKLIYSIEGP